VISTRPRPDESDEPGSDSLQAESPDAAGEWTVEGSAGRGAIDAAEVDRAARTYWELEADAYQAEHGAFLADPTAVVVDSAHQVGQNDYHDGGTAGDAATAGGGAAGRRVGFVWGPEGRTEDELALLGPADALGGQRILEVGCGAAQCSAWLGARGAHAVGIDISVAQLRHAHHLEPRPPVAAASATALPFRASSFDAAFSAYGAIQFVADLGLLLAEVRRVLRPGGRWVLSVTHPVRWALPDDPGPSGLTASGSYFDRTPYVERDDAGTAVYVEFHRTVGDYVTALSAAGLSVTELIEPEWPSWNTTTWGGWSPLRGTHLPGTLIIGCWADARS
jgi:SAM-dependent methyltransferase